MFKHCCSVQYPFKTPVNLYCALLSALWCVIIPANMVAMRTPIIIGLETSWSRPVLGLTLNVGEVCVPMVVKTYGAWGLKASDIISSVTYRLATPHTGQTQIRTMAGREFQRCLCQCNSCLLHHRAELCIYVVTVMCFLLIE